MLFTCVIKETPLSDLSVTVLLDKSMPHLQTYQLYRQRLFEMGHEYLFI